MPTGGRWTTPRRPRLSIWCCATANSAAPSNYATAPPGAIVWVRVRTNGINGVFSLWSDPAQIRVL